MKPGSEGAPWELEREGGESELDGAALVLQPAADGSYRVLALRFEVAASLDQRLGVEVGEFELKGLIDNHNHTVLR